MQDKIYNRFFSLTRSRIQDYMAELVTSVERIHKMHIVHRDLKHSNILLTDGALPTVKLSDFGLAKIIDCNSFFDVSFIAPYHCITHISLLLDALRHEGLHGAGNLVGGYLQPPC